MNMSDLRALQRPLGALIGVVALGAGLLYYIDYSLTNAQRDLARQQAQLREARTRLQRAGEERDIIVRYLGRYRQLEEIGFVGSEQRIGWLDALRLANQRMRLFGVDYQIGMQQPYPYANELNPGQLTLHQSLMKVNFKLLHEGDLMRFLGTLGQQQVGVFSVNQCMLERVEPGASMRYQPKLRAECELAWITLRPAATGEKKS